MIFLAFEPCNYYFFLILYLILHLSANRRNRVSGGTPVPDAITEILDYFESDW